MPFTMRREKTECPRRVSVSRRAGFDSHRLHQTSVLACARVGRGSRRLHARLTDNEVAGALGVGFLSLRGVIAPATFRRVAFTP